LNKDIAMGTKQNNGDILVFAFRYTCQQKHIFKAQHKNERKQIFLGAFA